MKLSLDQIEQLHSHINAKHIPYTEVRDEVLDHYQTALEIEEEKSIEEVLTELDETFTWNYRKELCENYLKVLKKEYPELLRNKFLEMFSWNRLPSTFMILALSFTIPYLLPNPRVLVHLITAFVIIIQTMESSILKFSYSKSKINYQFKTIDDEPTLARIRSRSLRGWGIFPLITYILLIIPLFVIYPRDLNDNFVMFLFSPPYLFSICTLTALMILFHIASFEVSRDRMKPYVR
ncbi:hypothetical protein MMU07_07200 [Aquiflexum sp. LQ15W]|uniref:hypothetical protein n=1 Tax=Cognataquiflexum nitidum TaxID=2922272 RepID=UPI001F12EBFA|nr:hypothetical protein [Cognataquiflexum nitidum]MCH6199357.1 hypothetical protein [Cognataquiflexum nitidum]